MNETFRSPALEAIAKRLRNSKEEVRLKEHFGQGAPAHQASVSVSSNGPTRMAITQGRLVPEGRVPV